MVTSPFEPGEGRGIDAVPVAVLRELLTEMSPGRCPVPSGEEYAYPKGMLNDSRNVLGSCPAKDIYIWNRYVCP